MPKHKSHWGGLTLALVLSATLGRATAANASTTANLLLNGDAELHRCTNDWTAQTPVPGWRVLRGAASVLCYSAFKWAHETPNLPSSALAGEALFGAPGADTAIEQAVDISAARGAIDSGAVTFTLAAWLGGWRDRPERATLTAVFLDETGHSTGTPVVLTDAGAQARGNLTGLLARETRGVVPGMTRRIVVTVHFLSGLTSYHNAYADNISLTLSGDVAGLVPAESVPPLARIPSLDHVYVVMMENTNYADVIRTNGRSVAVDAARMPFLASLAADGVILTNLWGTYHPSDQNYVAMVAGDTYRYGLVYYPDYNLAVTHVGDLLNAQGKSWRGYVQHMKTPCNLAINASGEGNYAPDDEPFVQFQDVIDNPARCIATVRPLADFEAAITSDTLPNFAWIAADGWWDGEGAWYENFNVAFSLAKQDEFLQSALQSLMQSAQWTESRSLLIVTWDETDGWGWPDNRVPTVLVGSPGLLRSGAVIDSQFDGYGVLRTIESAFGLGSLGRFDQFAEPLNAVFMGGDSFDEGTAVDLRPTPTVATRGSIQDTFGQGTTPAAVVQGQALALIVPAGLDDAVVNLEPLGQVPSYASTPYFDDASGTVLIPTNQLAPGVYGAWLRRGMEPPHRAPLMLTILPPALVYPNTPGIEIVGAAADGGGPAGVSVREGSNLIVRYCRPSGVAAADSWIGIFAAGTPPDQMTKDNANVIGFWLKTPGGTQGQPCGEAIAFASELTPGQDYQILLFRDAANGASNAVGRTAAFNLTPALP